MSSLRFIDHTEDFDGAEIVVVTSKQYLAVADDLLRRLFPDITADLLPHPSDFTVFIKDGDYVLH